MLKRVITSLALCSVALNLFAMPTLPSPSATNAYPDLPKITHVTTGEYMQKFQALQEADLPGHLKSLGNDAIFSQSYAPTLPKNTDYTLPDPKNTKLPPKHLSLREAILLSLRLNPEILDSELQRVEDKFSLEVERNDYMPQFTLDLTGNYQQGAQSFYNLTPGMTFKNTIGTSVTVGNNNALMGGSGNTQVQLTQPLLQGAGEVAALPLYQAYDFEENSKWTYKNSVINQVVSVINQYRGLVSAYNNLDIQEQSYLESEQMVNQIKMKIKLGKAAPASLAQQEAQLVSSQVNIYSQQIQLVTSYQGFLSVLGLAPTAKVLIDREIDYKKIPVPSLNDSIRIALKENPAYQQALIGIRGDERTVVSAKDARKWTLDLTANTAFGNARQVAQNVFSVPGVSSNVTTITSYSQAPTVGFDLTVPINDVAAKGELIDARVGLAQARLNLQQSKQQLISTVFNDWNTVQINLKQIAVAELQVKLQQENFDNTKLQASFGKADQLSVTQQQQSLVSNQTSLVSAEISYLDSVTTLYQELGMTLDVWKIKLRY